MNAAIYSRPSAVSLKVWLHGTREMQRTATHFMDDRFVNLGEEVILTLL